MSGPPLPPSDRIVSALWRRGDVQAAADFATAAVARNDRRRAQLHEQLAALRAGRALAPMEPVALDLELLLGLVDRYRYHEALFLAYATDHRDTPLGRRLVMILQVILAPFPDDADASFAAVHHLIGAGQAASALRALDEVVRQSVDGPPEWLLQRQRALGALVRGGWRDGPAPVQEVTRDTVLARLRARDLVGALEAARAADARELAAVLERLVNATERVFSESVPDSDDPETMPMEGHRLCEFQIRMGVLAQADRGYRAILRNEPDDARARSLLGDVIALRQALGDKPDPMPPRAASVAWLSKKSPPGARKGAWSSGSLNQPFGQDDDEDSTNVLEAAQEAELLLKLGKGEQALDMYRILAIRHPKQQAYRKRIAEIEALIAQRGVPNSAEVTLKHDLSELQRKAIPTNPRIHLPEGPSSPSGEHPRFVVEEGEEWPTVIEPRRPRLDPDE